MFILGLKIRGEVFMDNQQAQQSVHQVLAMNPTKNLIDIYGMEGGNS